MKQTELVELAKQYLILDDGLSKCQLIRRIQIVEGDLDCFATVRVHVCEQFGCRWRKDCIAEQPRETL